jgi:hypothetical protein
MREQLESIPEPTREQPQEKEYRPSKSEMLTNYEIHIKFLNRGCVVQVGCKSIAFTDINEAMTEINEYVTGDTWEVQKKWYKLLDM